MTVTAHPSLAPVTRVVGGVTLPVAGAWEIDPGHADVAFVGRHLMLTKVRGRFTDVRGNVHVAEDPVQSSVEVTIGMASVHSGSRVRDDHIRSADLFDVDTYPEATFRSVAVDWSGASGTVTGDLTIHGVTRKVPLHVTYEGTTISPDGSPRSVFSAWTVVDREDFGITWNMALETGGLLVSKEVRIEVDVETVLAG